MGIAVHGEIIAPVEDGDTAARAETAVRYPLGAEGIGNDISGLIFRRLHIATDEFPRHLQDIRLHLFVDKRRLFLHRLQGIKNPRQLLILDVNEFQGLRSNLGARGRNSGDLVPRGADFACLQGRVVFHEAKSEIIGDIGGGDDGRYAGKTPRLTCVKFQYFCVGIFTVENSAEEHARNFQVLDIRGAAGDFQWGIPFGDFLPYRCKIAHVRLPPATVFMASMICT